MSDDTNSLQKTVPPSRLQPARNCLWTIGNPGVAYLLQPFDEQRPVACFGHDVGVEVVALDALGIRQDDLATARRGRAEPRRRGDTLGEAAQAVSRDAAPDVGFEVRGGRDGSNRSSS